MSDDIRMVPIDDLHFEKQSDELPADLVDRIVLIHHVFRDYLSATLDETIENFTFDKHPESEIRVWEHMACAVITLRYDRDWPLEKMPLAVKAVLGLSMGTMPPGELSEAEMAQILDVWNTRRTI